MTGDSRHPWQGPTAALDTAPGSAAGGTFDTPAHVKAAAEAFLAAAAEAAANASANNASANAGATPHAGAIHDAARAYSDVMRDFFGQLPPLGNSRLQSGANAGASIGAPPSGAFQGGAVPGRAPPDMAFGFTREHQLRWQRLATAWQQLEEATRRLQRFWGDVLRDASAAFVEFAPSTTVPGTAPGAPHDAAALRRLYNTWIDCAEQAYARTAHGAPFCAALADAVNAGSRWRRELKATGDAAAGFLDLPTRGEIDALHLRLRALESELRARRSGSPEPQSVASDPAGADPAAPSRPPAGEAGCSERDAVWRQGKLVLYRYRALAAPVVSTPLLIVYALVNRPYMMDLQPDRSLIRGLLRAGLDVYLVDWGYPDGADRFTALADYLEGHLAGCVGHILQRHSLDRLNLLGVCQGGVLSLCYSALHPEQVRNLVTMVTPVDFRTPADLLSKWVARIDVDAWLDGGNASGDALNQVFLWLMPFRLLHQKYVDLMASAPGREGLEDFMRVERWIFDSPDQAGAAFGEFVRHFYQENRLAENRLQIGGKTVDLGRLALPILNLIGKRDHLVPPAASAALGRLVGSEDYTALEFDLGHIGMYLSARAQRDVPAAIADWLKVR